MDNQQQQQQELSPPPHVLIFPFPAQGHVNPMLNLAELLCHSGLHVTFLVTTNIHHRLLHHGDIQSKFGCYPRFRFEAISNGRSEDEPPLSADKAAEFFYLFTAAAKPQLRELLRNSNITCVVGDGLLSLAVDVSQEIGIPCIVYRTSSTCDFWAVLCAPKLIEAGELPFKGNDLDIHIENIPGMEGFLRRRDLPSVFRAEGVINRDVQTLVHETLQIPRAQGLILNTFEELEGPILAQARHQCPKIYSIGPLHAHLKVRITTSHSSSSSLWEEDKSCLAWLDLQPPKSVIYVSFGSHTLVTKDQLMEFWHGLINSGKKFLWVIRPDSLVGKEGVSQIPKEVLESTRGRGFMVEWAPQEEVLAHEAIGVFLTHSGWNSTLESIVEGVPMICWPFFGDQQINSKFVEEIWKIGLDMKDSCDRVVIEKMVRDLMDIRKKEFKESADQLAKLAKEAIDEGGSSYCNLDHLIRDIRLMSGQPQI